MIQVLPPHIASQIAAGEVVQRPASVIKELLENAVDSGATQIDVVLMQSGATLMQVTDNGCGLSPHEVVTAFERHATSKIGRIEDLQQLHTFGFRGEALPSIASVAQVQVRTRREEDAVGTEVVISGSQLVSHQEVACPQGSTFSVRNLFYNVPARRKFLKSEAVELKHCVEEFRRVALCNPHIAFSFTHNGVVMYQLETAPNLRVRILQAIGKDLGGKLVEIGVDTPLVSIKGYVERPQDAKKTGSSRYFFVNDRYFKSNYLHKAITNAYQPVLPEDRTPSYFIYFTTNPENIDVNIHPSKTEVRFEDEPLLFQVLFAAVRESLGKFSLAPSLDFESNGGQHQIPVALPKGTFVPTPTPQYDPLFNPFVESRAPQKEALQKEAPQKEAPLPYFVGEALFNAEKPILPLAHTYLATTVKSGLLLIHKKRAWERIYFEELLERMEHHCVPSQCMLFPVALNLQPPQAALLEQCKEALGALGFGFEGTEVVSLPVDHPAAEELVSESVQLLLEQLEEQPLQAALSEVRTRTAALLASRQALWHKDQGPAEYQAFIDRLFACQTPEFTPSGARCYTILPLPTIDTYFD